MTEDVKVQILDDKGEVMQTIPGSKRKGLNKALLGHEDEAA